MADTTFVLDGKEVTLSNYKVVNDSVLNEIRKTLTSLPDDYSSQPTRTDKIDYLLSDAPYLIFLLIILFIVIKIRTVFVDGTEKNSRKSSSNYHDISIDLSKNHDAGADKDYYHYKGSNLDLKHSDIEFILEKYFPYYRNLEQHLQFRFFDRTTKFMYSKDFLIYSNEPFKEMPVLISAAAVQISFGLDEFELPHYKYIRVHREEYFADHSLRILAGNVEGDCITLAWTHLLKGFYDYEDGSNVGLHEMAHALYYQEMIVEKDEPDFINHFSLLMNDGEGVLQQKQCPYNLYSAYAFTNLQEFWAVSVELFFEKAHPLQKAYPNIFYHLQNLLKQNPLVPHLPLS
jgi:Mlc titration factor MtfA (ptsG expression regulator)